MTGSEFAFLALGLMLGVAAGAAIVEVLRARPPAPRQVRVTVAPESIPSRSTTLGFSPFAEEEAGPARGGPADHDWQEGESEPAAAATQGESPSHGERAGPGETADRDERGTRPERSSPAATTPPGESAMTAARVPGTGRPDRQRPKAAGAIAISHEPDPMMLALRAAEERAVRVNGGAGEAQSSTTAERRDSTQTPGGTPAGATALALADRSPAALPEAPAKAAPAKAAPDSGPSPVSAAGSEPVVSAVASVETPRAKGGPAGSPKAPPSPIGGGDSGPCAELRRVSDERCALATRSREQAEAAVAALRGAQHDYDDHHDRAERAAATADPRTIRTAKEDAQRRFRHARADASRREDIEAAARDWLTEINRINHESREAAATAARERAAANELITSIERLTVEADAARISAETAEQACVVARTAVADCDEQAQAARTARRPAAAAAAPLAATAARSAAGLDQLGLDQVAVEESAPLRAPSSRNGDAAILRLLRGDRRTLTLIAEDLGDGDAAESRRWQLAIADLLEAIIARAIEAASLDFPEEHPFWGPFTRDQNRDIVAALSSLGYRFDGLGGWADERIPSQRDLSLAVGYAGLDPMRIRRWPDETEMVALFADVRVAADDYLASAAADLTLGELVSLLGRRADALTDVWNAWGLLRPLLLETA